MKYGLSERQPQEVTSILSSYDAIEEAVFFGSRAIDTYKEASDVDIAIKGEKANWQLATEIKNQLEEETYLPFFFDVVAYNSINNKQLLAHINQKGKRIFSKTMSKWKTCTLGELGEIITGKTPSKDNAEEWGDKMPFVTPSDYKYYRNKAYFSDRNLSSEGVNRLKNKVLPKNSIMVTCIGSMMGKVAINALPVITNQQINSIIPNPEVVHGNFLYYRLVSLYEVLRSYGADGTAVPILNKGDFSNIETTIPPLSEQRAIAEVLSSLDDKIELLHRQNQTLEQLAETLFREWFVEEAKADWEERALSKVVDIGIGRTPPRREFHWFSKDNRDIKWVSIKDLGNGGVFVLDTSEYLTREAVNHFKIPVIPPKTVLLSFKMTLGRVAITTENMLSNEAIGHFKFNSNTPFCKEYLYFFLKNYPYQTLGSTSSIVTSINLKIIKDLIITIPNKEILQKFKHKSSDYFKKIKNNQGQIKILEKLLDTLLPKLINGELSLIKPIETKKRMDP